MSKNVTKSIVFCLLSCFLFATFDTAIKLLHGNATVIQILFFRCFFSILFFSPIILHRTNRFRLRTCRPHLHLGRGLMGFAILSLYFYACQNQSLTSVVAISFTTPLFVTLLSIPLLGAVVGKHRWSALCLGFLGTIFIVNPTNISFDIALIAALCSAIIGALNVIHTRLMGWTESTLANIVWSNIMWLTISLFLLPFFWLPLSWEQLGILAFIGFVGGIAQFLGTESLALANPAITSSFSYTRLLWAIIFSFIIWQELPEQHVVIGSCCIIGSSLYILYREIILKRKRIPSRRVF